jgi:sugar phosphate isomerase/epimerase
MQVAFSTLSTPHWSLETVAERAALLGFPAVEICAGQPGGLDPEASPERCAEVRRQFAGDGVAICALSSGCRLAGHGADPLGATGAEVRRWLDVAAAIGAPVLGVFGGECPDPPADGEALAQVADALSGLAEAARAAGVRLALETHGGFGAASRVGRVLAQVDDPWIGACWDWLDTVAAEESPAASARHLQGRILHVHAKDAVRDAHGGWGAEHFGRGVLPLGDLYRELVAAEFDGALSLEWERADDPDPGAALRWYRQAAGALLGSLRR